MYVILRTELDGLVSSLHLCWEGLVLLCCVMKSDSIVVPQANGVVQWMGAFFLLFQEGNCCNVASKMGSPCIGHWVDQFAYTFWIYKTTGLRLLYQIIWTGVTIYLEEDYQCIVMTQKKKSHQMIRMLLYPPNNEVVGGYIGFTPSVRPSVRPSVHPSVCPSRLPCPLCNIYSSGWILSILATNDYYHERVCRTQGPLTLTYIFKVIRPWLRKSCPLCSIYSSEWILFIFGTNDHYR